MFVVFKAFEQGLSHKEIDTECQDSADSLAPKAKSLGIAVVADGHGSEKHFRSNCGSKFAVDIAKSCILDFSNLGIPEFDKITNLGNIEKATQSVRNKFIKS